MSILYTGTDPSNFDRNNVVHFPVIEVVARSPGDWGTARFTHFVLTSKNAVTIFCDYLKASNQKVRGVVIAVGKATARALRSAGLPVDVVAKDEHQEGVIEELKKLELGAVCLPRSAQARKVIDQYLDERGVEYEVWNLYDVKTAAVKKLPDLDTIEEIVFTSPSTVRGFVELFGKIPSGKLLRAIGPITKKALQEIEHGV